MFTKIRSFFKSVEKTRTLHFLSKELRKPIDIYKPTEHIELKRKCLDSLIKLSISDPVVEILLTECNANEKTLRKIYEDLTLVAGVEYGNGFFVPASSVIDTFSLGFILFHLKGDCYSINSLDSHNSLLFIANKLVLYFKENNPTYLWEPPV